MRMFPSLTTFHRPPEWPHRPPITDFASIAPLSGLIAPRGAISPTLRTTGLANQNQDNNIL